MPRFTWTKDLETGNENIDQQHKKIFSSLDELSLAIKENQTQEAIKNVIEGLTLYILDHFRDEQDFMKSRGYPFLSEHIKIHEDIFTKAADIILKYRAGDIEMTTPLVVFITELIVVHIKKEDKKFFEWLASKAQKDI